ncbi:MAG: tetratricopeptide repeat protein [Kofleriaceae bacterium]
MSAAKYLLLGLLACSKSDEPRRVPVPVPSAPDAATKPADDRYADDALGALTFEHSEGTPEARAHFTRGLLALHSFWYDEAIRQFQQAITADREMNLAYWGLAMSHLKLLWGEDDLTAARLALSKMPNPDRLSPREQAWVMAAVELVKAGDVRTSRKRFAESLTTLHTLFPDDEAKTFLALALLSTTRPEDPDTLDVRKRAAALAAEVYARNPKHPGAAHYIIHAYDTPELASLALPHARAYANLAPAAFHARHMPAHIFSRLGMWSDAIASCHAAWDASLGSARREKLSANHHDFHSLGWLIEMYFERGQRKQATAMLATFANAVDAGLGRQHRALYATEVASFMMRTGDWARVDELLAPLAKPPVDEPIPAGAAGSGANRAGEPSHCAPGTASPLELVEQLAVLDARARAAAMQHDATKTRTLLAETDALRIKLRPSLAATQPKEALARIDASHARHRQVLLAHATTNDRALLPLLRAQAAEAQLEVGGESNPSGFLAHDDTGDTLLRLGKPADALAAYQRALNTHPGRARSLLGAARAATKAGDAKTARAMYEQLVNQWAAADPDTDGLAEARAALAN